MYDDDFRNSFLEFLDENSNNHELLDTLKPFIGYAWGTTEINGVKTEDSDAKQVEFINWISDNGATMDAIKAAIYIMNA